MMEEVLGLWDSHVGGGSTAMRVWGQEERAEGTSGWAEKVAGPRQGELEQGSQPAANWHDLQRGGPSQHCQLGCLQQQRGHRCRRDLGGQGRWGNQVPKSGEQTEKESTMEGQGEGWVAQCCRAVIKVQDGRVKRRGQKQYKMKRSSCQSQELRE